LKVLRPRTPEIQLRNEDGAVLAARAWRLEGPVLAISSAPFGGGLGLRHWVLNAQVPHGYDCDDPAGHLDALASAAGLVGPGVGMMTAVDVRLASTLSWEAIDVDATVGVTTPLWAAEDEPAHPGRGTRVPGVPRAPGVPTAPSVGTINMVISLPKRLSDAALVNAVGTATEAKTQALWDAGLPGTGTATDAMCILCPPDGPAHAYGGPRSTWGARLARAVYRAVLTGCPTVGST
jgi:adenosylcobinamide hydrolase